MVIDFTFIKNKINKLIIDKLDHNNINNILKHSTAENIAEWVWDNIIKNIDTKNAELFEIKLWEGPNSFVTYRGGNDF
jgi:6-pyruvoyl-tetrahydropterin synthase